MTEFYTGKPCKKGHVLRYKIGRACVECKKTAPRVSREKQNVSAKKYYNKNKQLNKNYHRKHSKNYYERNKDKVKERVLRYIELNPEKAKIWVKKSRENRKFKQKTENTT